MDRRDLLKGIGGAAAFAPILAAPAAQACEAASAMRAGDSAAGAAGRTAAILLYPGFSAIDVATARQVLHARGVAQVTLLSAGPPAAAVPSDLGLAIQPDAAMAGAHAHDLLFVPGGSGAKAALQRMDVIAFLKRNGGKAMRVAATGDAGLLLRKAGIAGAAIGADGQAASVALSLTA